jgi:hypothetical protein
MTQLHYHTFTETFRFWSEDKQLNTYVQLRLNGMVLNEAEGNPDLYTRNNLFRGETTIYVILTYFLRMCSLWQYLVI